MQVFSSSLISCRNQSTEIQGSMERKGLLFFADSVDLFVFSEGASKISWFSWLLLAWKCALACIGGWSVVLGSLLVVPYQGWHLKHAWVLETISGEGLLFFFQPISLKNFEKKMSCAVFVPQTCAYVCKLCSQLDFWCLARKNTFPQKLSHFRHRT